MATARLRVEIQGAVQGVGFRPFVYRLAGALALSGWVINDTQGVFIEAEGPRATLEGFLERLRVDRPPRALIQSLAHEWLAPAGYTAFEIRHSDNHGAKTVLVLPDIATCPDCLAEVLNPANRRHLYPFTNCTNCGPRFTIVEALPYDRPNTTMRRFALCPACRSEYESPPDRRFHAQPNACPICGPGLALYVRGVADNGASAGTPGNTWPGAFGEWALAGEGDAALDSAAAALRGGAIVGVKGMGGFHLIVAASNAAGIARLRERKPRHEKPFALMVRDLAQAGTLCELDAAAQELLASPEAPIVLLRKLPGAPIAAGVAPGNPYLGIMLPYTPLHHLLLRAVDLPVVATSGNLADEPICTDEWEGIGRLGHTADQFLVHNRPIARHVDDSVAVISLGKARLVRRARGYAPLPVLLASPLPTILAVGAHLKSTVALSVGRQAFISQHIGDLETPEAMAAFERVIADFLQLYEARPVAIAHDLHPDYLSTRWAQENAGLPGSGSSPGPQSGAPALAAGGFTAALVPVQHHHAHLAACLAENGVEGPALGVIWDGAGYGGDGTIWGGEFLLGDAAGYRRVAHLRPFRLPGGEAAIREPARQALALLWELHGEAALEQGDLAPLRAYRPAQLRLLGQMLAHGANAPLTTSAGRLFDAVAALAGLHQRVSFEGQAAMALEYAADPALAGAYPFGLLPGEDRAGTADGAAPGAGRPLVLDWQPLVEALLDDLRRGVTAGTISARFHNALVEGIVAVASAVGQERVALSGGCFQNRLLTERAALRLRAAGFDVLLHSQVPANDGGISLGQLAVAGARLAGE